MIEARPTARQIAVLKYVTAMQRELQSMLRAEGLDYAAQCLGRFEDPATHAGDDAT